MVEDLEGAHLIGGIPRGWLKAGKERRLLGKRIESGELLLMVMIIRKIGLWVGRKILLKRRVILAGLGCRSRPGEEVGLVVGFGQF
jgi:hypothetical protein